MDLKNRELSEYIKTIKEDKDINFETYISLINSVEDIESIKRDDRHLSILSNMPKGYTYKLCKKADELNIKYIEDAFRENIINQEERDFYIDSYSDSMSKIRLLFDAQMQIVNSPVYGMKTINLRTDERKRLFHGSGDPIVNSSRLINSILPLEIDYKNQYDNFTYFQIPGPKGVKRAINKMVTKYKPEYFKEVNSLKEKYKDQNSEEYKLEFSKILKPHERMNDIYRCSMSEVCYSDIKGFLTKLGFNEKELKEKLMHVGMEESLVDEILVDLEFEEDKNKELRDKLLDVGLSEDKIEEVISSLTANEPKSNNVKFEILRLDDKHSNNSPFDKQYKKNSRYRDFKLILMANKDYIDGNTGKVVPVSCVFERQVKLLSYAKRERESHGYIDKIREVDEEIREKGLVTEELMNKRNKLEAKNKKVYTDGNFENNIKVLEMATRMEIRELRSKFIKDQEDKIYDIETIDEYSEKRNKERARLKEYLYTKKAIIGKEDVYEVVYEKPYQDPNIVDFLRKKLTVEPDIKLNFREVLEAIHVASEERKKNKKYSIFKEEIDIVQDDYETSRGANGIQSFLLRYWDVIIGSENNQRYIPEAVNGEEYKNGYKVSLNSEKKKNFELEQKYSKEINSYSEVLKDNKKVIKGHEKYLEEMYKTRNER